MKAYKDKDVSLKESLNRNIISSQKLRQKYYNVIYFCVLFVFSGKTKKQSLFLLQKRICLVICSHFVR